MARGQRVLMLGALGGMLKDVLRSGRFNFSYGRETDALRVSQMKGMTHHQTGAPGMVVGEGDKVAAVLPGQLEADFQGLGMQEVVTVHKEDILPPGLSQGPVSGAAHSSVRLADGTDATVPGGISVQEGRCSIRTAVVHADGFPILMRLGQQAVKATWQVFLHIVAGDDDGNLRHVSF